MSQSLPSIREDLVQGTKTGPTFYKWFGRIEAALKAGTLSDDQAAAAIAAIATLLGSPDGSVGSIPPLAFLRSTTYVSAGDGITVSGTLAGGGVTVSLAEPATAGGFVPTLIASGDTFTVPADTQALFAYPIDVEGFLAVDGVLVEVS